MSTVVLARKYRPRSFAQMVGQEHVVQALTNALKQQRLHHAYLFTGTRGIGKTTVSRILAKSLNCTGPDGSGGVTAEPCGVCQACTEIYADHYIDYIELDAASNRSIDEIRDLIERAAYKPGVGRFKVFMIDEAHQLTKDAFNALLKTLEEPPEYLKFVLATTDPEKMLPTVLSRCLQFNLRPMAPATVREHLQRVLQAEQVGFDDGALRLLGQAARGSMRDGLSLTDQAIAYGGGRLDEATVRQMLGSVDRSHARALVEALARRDGAAVLAAVDGLRGLGLSAAGTLEEIAQLLQQMAVEQAVPGALDAEGPHADDAQALAASLAPDETQLLYSMALHGREELSLMADEYGALVMVLLRFLAFAPSGATAAPREPREPKVAPLRTPAPPAISVSKAVPLPAVATVESAPPRLAEPPARVAPAADPRMGDRWDECVKTLCRQGAVAALVRELAQQSALVHIDAQASPERWHLQVASEPLRNATLADKLATALSAHLGQPTVVELVAGTPTDTPAQREAAEKQRRQAAAESTIQQDPVVQELMQQFKTARLVPGSIKPL
jgi:DNA polymerase III subunit gamma/tau